MSQQKSESKREEFRRYLEGTGVLDALTKVLVGLYEEPDKPSDALDFVKHHLHGGPLESIDAEALKKENEELQQRNRELEEQVAQLQTALSKYESESTETVAS
ncbi:c-Myc-binding protein homolog [Halichondria panicea]|uniref:c-Myc-binding protein homolog n=1 Tax=Halichondria panicea TaxID=6063 RepID=UPI00312BAC51